MARYLGVSAGKWKYWEVQVEGATLIVDEGALGTLGKRTVHAFPDEAAARKDAAAREKKVLAKGFSLHAEPTKLAAGLLAAYAPYDLEAARGDPDRAVTKALAALQARDLAEPKELGMCPITLARRGHTDGAQQVLDAFDARRADFTGERLAGHLALVAAGHLALGHADAFDVVADEAFACLPAWSTARAWPGYIAAEGVALAEALLDRGRRDDARALFNALGHFGLDALLARGELDWYDAIAPGTEAATTMSDRYRLARGLAEGRERFAEVFAALAAEDYSAMTTRDAERRILYLGASLRDARDRDLASSQAPLLRRAVHACRAAHPSLVSNPSLWVAVAALSKLGHPITAELSWASSPPTLTRAAGIVIAQAPGAPDGDALGERLRALPAAQSRNDALWMVDAVAARARLGEVFAPDALRDLAVLANRESSLLSVLAAVALGQGDRALAWELFALVKPRDLASAAEAARSALAGRGLLQAYKTLSDAIPPSNTSRARYECWIIASVAEVA